MKEITQDNYQNLEFNWEGIIIGVPTVPLYYNSELYMYKQQVNYDTEPITRSYYISGYNGEDKCINGFSADWTPSGDTLDDIFHWTEDFKYYQFDDLKEFCEWYLQKTKDFEKSIKSFKDKTQTLNLEHLQSLPFDLLDCLNHLPPTGLEIEPGNIPKPKITKREYYKDILELLEIKQMIHDTRDQFRECKDNSMKQLYANQLERWHERFQNWLDEYI